MLDATIIRAHAVGSFKSGNQQLGRSRGGSGTKNHAGCDGFDNPEISPDTAKLKTSLRPKPYRPDCRRSTPLQTRTTMERTYCSCSTITSTGGIPLTSNRQQLCVNDYYHWVPTKVHNSPKTEQVTYQNHHPSSRSQSFHEFQVSICTDNHLPISRHVSYKN